MPESKRKTIELFTNRTTEGVESLTKVINFTGFQNIKFAELKTTLHAHNNADGGGILPIDWRITKIVINNKTFFPSSRTNSTNKVHDSNGSAFFKDVLRVNDTNTISIHWTAPFGAGVTSPHGAVSAVLEVIGDSIPFAEDLQFDPINQVTDLTQFAKNASLPTALVIIAALIGLALVAFILLRAAPVVSDVKEVSKTLK